MAADYAHKFVRVTISGTCFGGAEEWSTGFQLGSPTADMVGASAPAAENLAAVWETFFETPANKFSSAYKTTEVKCALIDTDGKTDLDNIDYYTYPTPLSGGYTSNVLPAQITLAATLTSDNQRGLASKGRMYLPGINEPISDTTGKISDTFQATLATNFKTFLDAVNAAVDVPGDLVLASKGHRDKTAPTPTWIGGQTAWVTGCRIGNVYDTQRRRRNGLAETYEARVLA
jgi:hypothetical protein